MAKAGIRNVELMRRWGLKSSTVSDIISGKTRSHLREKELAKLLTEALDRKISWSDIFTEPSYIKQRDLIRRTSFVHRKEE